MNYLTIEDLKREALQCSIDGMNECDSQVKGLELQVKSLLHNGVCKCRRPKGHNGEHYAFSNSSEDMIAWGN